MLAEIKSLRSYDSEEIPNNTSDCAVSLIVSLGPKDVDTHEDFDLEVITIGWLQNIGRAWWGRNSLILPVFDWNAVTSELEQMLAQCAGEDWPQVREKVCEFLEPRET
jgi:hypothetical protein